MGLLDGFEKLINEHGSAVILKERIALANDKYSALEKELSASKARESELTAENQSLKLDNEKLKQEIQRRDDVIQNEKSHGDLLEQQKVNILLHLSKSNETEPEQIARALNIGKQVAIFHLEELSEKNMAFVDYIMGSSYWSIDQEGRRYLVKNNLIT